MMLLCNKLNVANVYFIGVEFLIGFGMMLRLGGESASFWTIHKCAWGLLPYNWPLPFYFKVSSPLNMFLILITENTVDISDWKVPLKLPSGWMWAWANEREAWAQVMRVTTSEEFLLWRNVQGIPSKTLGNTKGDCPKRGPIWAAGIYVAFLFLFKGKLIFCHVGKSNESVEC